MKITEHTKTTITRTRLTIEIDETMLEQIVREALAKKYPVYDVVNFEVVCGMSQGEGYFSSIDVALVCELETDESPTQPKEKRR